MEQAQGLWRTLAGDYLTIFTKHTNHNQSEIFSLLKCAKSLEKNMFSNRWQLDSFSSCCYFYSLQSHRFSTLLLSPHDPGNRSTFTYATSRVCQWGISHPRSHFNLCTLSSLLICYLRFDVVFLLATTLSHAM